MQAIIDAILDALASDSSLENREDFHKLKNTILAETKAQK